MRNAGRLKLGYYPLPHPEGHRLRNLLSFPNAPYSALDPCVGDGNALAILTGDSPAVCSAIELDSFRAEQASKLLKIKVIQGDALECHSRVDSLSFLYLNPPYDFEVGKTGNMRMEVVFLRHTGRWLRAGGVLVFVIPQAQLSRCADTLAEHFENIHVFRLSDPEALRFNQIAVVASRRPRDRRLQDKDLRAQNRYLVMLSEKSDLPFLPDDPPIKLGIPPSPAITIEYRGLPFDEIEDKLPESAAYRQIRRILLRQPANISGRPLTPLHGGHVGLLCTAGMLNGVFGEGELRHMANWQSVKYTRVWQEFGESEKVRHIREYFSHECTLLWSNGYTQILKHADHQNEDAGDDDPENTEDTQPTTAKPSGNSNVVVMHPRNRV